MRKPGTQQELGSSASAFEREAVLAPADITGFRSITKMPPVATIAEGMVMLQHAAETTDAVERKRMLQLAVESFEQAVAMCPASPECLVRLSDGLYQLALPAARCEARPRDRSRILPPGADIVWCRNAAGTRRCI